MYIYDNIFHNFSCNVSDKLYRENQNTHFMFNNFFFENAVYKNLRKKCGTKYGTKHGTARQATGDNTIRHMRYIPNATYTHSEYVILTAFPHQQWLRESAPVLRYRCIACLVTVYMCSVLKHCLIAVIWFLHRIYRLGRQHQITGLSDFPTPCPPQRSLCAGIYSR